MMDDFTKKTISALMDISFKHFLMLGAHDYKDEDIDCGGMFALAAVAVRIIIDQERSGISERCSIDAKKFVEMVRDGLKRYETDSEYRDIIDIVDMEGEN